MNKKELKPKIRFKNCLDNWNKKQLNNIVERLDNLRVPITENRREKGNTPYYGANGIQDYVKGCTHKGNNILIAEDGANDLTNYPVYFVSGNIWVNNHTHVIKSNNENEYDNLFLSMSLKTVNYESIVSGSSRVKLTAKQLMNIETFIPDIKEQKSIGEFFDKIDKSIKQSEEKVEKWKNIRT